MTFGKKLLVASLIVGILYLIPSAVDPQAQSLEDRVNFYRNLLSLEQVGKANSSPLEMQQSSSRINVYGSLAYPQEEFNTPRRYTFYVEYRDEEGNSFWADGRNPHYVEFGGRVSPSLWSRVEGFFQKLFGKVRLVIDFGR